MEAQSIRGDIFGGNKVPHSKFLRRHFGISVAAVSQEDVEKEDADARSEAPAEPNQLLPRPPMPLSQDGRCRRFSLALLSTV